MPNVKGYESIIPLMKKKSEFEDVVKFQQQINIFFHDVEAKHYDSLHFEMWQSLPRQYELLIADVYIQHLRKRHNLKVLDVGCGTGLATELILKTSLESHINHVTLLDTSTKMLSLAQKRSNYWGKQVSLIHGDISHLHETFDFVLISSVLHHIPNLETFLQDISALQLNGGVIMTIHDPLRESITSAIYQDRCNSYRQHQFNRLQRMNILEKTYQKIKKIGAKKPDYIAMVNRQLLENGIINTPLTAVELWSITDIHVEDLPYSSGMGISIDQLSSILSDYERIAFRTYAYFGQAGCLLDKKFQAKELNLSHLRDKYGRNFGSIWIKN